MDRPSVTTPLAASTTDLRERCAILRARADTTWQLLAEAGERLILARGQLALLQERLGRPSSPGVR
jgi:hypothetical protein